MAKSQQPGGGTMTIWMIVFVFFWLVSTVWLVIIYTGQEELRGQITRIERENAQLISDSERNSIPLVRERVDGGQTVVGLMEEARKTTAEMATGDGADSVAVVQTKRDDFLRQVRDDALVDKPARFDGISLLESATLIYEAHRKNHELRAAVETRAAELDAEVARLVQLTADQKADLDERAKSIEDQLVSAEQSRDEFRKDREEAVKVLEQDFNERRAQTDADLTTERQQRAGAEKRAGDLQLRLAFLEERFSDQMIGPEALSTARQPDGRILTAVPGDGVVYTNLGVDDHMPLGLRFTVYDSSTGIPADGRGKALIEVVSINETSSECRIVAGIPARPIIAGDIIANPAYDRDRSPSFVVGGWFDLDRDGAADPDGDGVVRSIINTWGGRVVPEVDGQTDFVVIGAAPRRPKPVNDPSPEQASRIGKMQNAVDRYEQMIATANGLSVPVLTQEVFLNFLGRNIRVSGK